MVFGLLRRLRHERIWKEPFPDAWRAHLEENVPYVRLLDADDRAWLEDLVQVFLHDKRFEGAGGLEVTDEMRVTIAGQACVLLLGDEETAVYPELGSVVIYPSTYVVGAEARRGESWTHGLVVLAWDASHHGARNVEDGLNVVLHEFAHQLDQELRPADGAPELPSGMTYGAWAKVLGREYERLREHVSEDRKTVLREYGATSPAEFFAVATECFFEKPLQMHARMPDLYAQLAAYYRQDPAERLRERKRQQNQLSDQDR